MKFLHLLEVLTQSEREELSPYIANRGDIKFGAFEKERTIIDMGLVKVEELPPIPVPNDIKSFLDSLGFTIKNYRSGYAYKKDKPNNLFKIGSILQKNNKQELLKSFNGRTSMGEYGNTITTDQEYVMVISHNPEDVAAMSTDKNWSSCMNLRGGVNRSTPFCEVQYGGMVAYLISKKFAHLEDKEDWLDHSTSRIAIKRFVNDDNDGYMFVQERRIYGDIQIADYLQMETKLENLLSESNKQTFKKGLYSMASKTSYSDSLRDVLINSPAGKLYISDMIDDMIENDEFNEQFLNHIKRNLLPEVYDETIKQLIIGNVVNNGSFDTFSNLFYHYVTTKIFNVNIINDIYERIYLNVENTQDEQEIQNNYHKLDFAISETTSYKDFNVKEFLDSHMGNLDEDSTMFHLLSDYRRRRKLN